MTVRVIRGNRTRMRRGRADAHHLDQQRSKDRADSGEVADQTTFTVTVLEVPADRVEVAGTVTRKSYEPALDSFTVNT
jgi:hypothetical protein